MKSIKSALVGAIALASGAAMANATTILYINGSTAFRTAAVAGIDSAFSPGYVFGYTGSSESGQNAAIYSGNVSGHNMVIITSWTGSESGVQATADNAGATPVKFIHAVGPTALTAGTTGAITLTTAGVPNLDDPTVQGEAGTFDSIAPSACFSDTYQNTGKFKAGVTITYNDGSHHTFAALTPVTPTSGAGDSVDGIVGVIPFGFYVTSNSTITNVTDWALRNLYKYGKVPRSFFTGLNADEGKQVYAIGRNNDSGTHADCMLYAGIGATTPVQQYEPKDSTGAYIGQNSTASGQTIASLNLWDQDTVNSIVQPVGTSGYNSNGKLVAALKVSNASTYGDLLGYSGPPTSNSPAIGPVTFQGVAFSIAAVEEGAYPVFNYEHLYENTSNIASGDLTADNAALTAIGNFIFTDAGLAGIPTFDNMNVYRDGLGSGDSDGNLVDPYFAY